MLDSALADFTHLPPLISGPLYAVIFWWVTTALGHRLLRLCRISLSGFTVWERGLISAAVGAGVLQLLPLTLSLFGRMRPVEIRMSLGALAMVLALDLVHVAVRVATECSRLHLRAATSPTFVWWSLFILLMGVLLVRAVTFGELGDDDGIHLAAPKRWLQAGTLSYLPSYTHTNATLGFDMLYLIALVTWSPIGAKILHYTTGVFALFGLALCARRMLNSDEERAGAGTPVATSRMLGKPSRSPQDVAGMLTISILLIATPLWNLPILFGNAMDDLSGCWMTVMTVLIWLVWRKRSDWSLLVCMALCAGFAASFKMTSIQVAIAWAPILTAETWRRSASWPRALALLTVFGLATLAPVLPWLIRNTWLTGNPLYPMFSSWIPTRDWSAEHALVFGRYVRYYAWGVAAGSRLGENERKGLLLLTAALVSVGGVTTAVFVRDRIGRSLIVFATLFTLISVSLSGLIFRYWLPATMCLALVMCVMSGRRWSQRLQWPASLLLVIALAVQTRQGSSSHGPAGFMGDLRMATGLSTFEREYANQPLVNMWKYINSNTPPDARVLFAAFYTSFGASSYGGFWVNRMCYTTDSHLQGYFPLEDWASFKESIVRTGVTYVVISDQQFNQGRHGFSFLAGRNEYPFARRLVEEYGQKVYQTEHIQLYQLQSVGKTAELN